ncbi:ribose 5-phosphate isomerase B [Aerococcus christensenii]|uniref:Ribose 5-phosphate isomerase B n=1 Tax=Aerococcus christensenii TaxID=87541 RepID=A0A0X8F8H3_9LACT|nr:ribose 5-phosphate isomerase B [Aerococcus christensenii]AMB92716.1 ribose-5-phosphate isomerase [Aerococcus christensenii]PKY91784.1 ribose 5-phosphate isomerase B [Aerococcus christensenii]
MKIAIGGDHVGQLLKPEIIEFLKKLGHEVKDFGTYTTERTDYPIYAKQVAESVVNGEYDKGVLICGTGVGISIAANKVKGVRAVCCSEPYSAKLSRQHNDTNILAFGSRVVGLELAKMIVEEWLSAEYEGGRHAKRVEMISEIEEKQNLDNDSNIKLNC